MTTSLRLNPVESLGFKVWDQHRRSGLGDDIPRYLVSRCMNARTRHDPETGGGHFVFDYDARPTSFATTCIACCFAPSIQTKRGR